jgi:hypothetical protein
LASEGWLAVALRSFELLLADGSVAPESRDRLVSGVADVSRVLRGGAGGSGTEEGAGPLLESAAWLLSTSVPKLSFPCDGSDRTDLDGAPWKGTFGAGSDVTLYTGGLSRWNWSEISKERAIPGI